MKKISILSTLLALILLVGCAKPDASPTTTAPVTEPPATTAPHAHLDPVVYPDTIDFSNPEALETLFDMCEITDGITVNVQAAQKQIALRGKVNGENFALLVNLAGANGHTTPEQIVTCAKLFWYCYPQMYMRFAHADTPKTIVLKIEDSGYEIAEAGGDTVHIHDKWLKDHPQDFDCLTHEFAHIIQGGWQGGFVPSYGEDTYMIERFADYCRYLYSFKDGLYNDLTWELQTINNENTYYKSVRFWVWLDYTYSTKEIDIMQRMASLIALEDRNYRAKNWEPEGSAWKTVFAGTGAEGKNLNELWSEFAASGITTLSSGANRKGSVSPLLKAVPFRQALRDRYDALNDYIK